METIRPGTLVVLKAKVQGGVHYAKQDITRETEGATERKEWRTTRIIDDKEEFKEAARVRIQARRAISRHCIHTPFGDICPDGNEEALADGLREARELCMAFNQQAETCQVVVTTLRGRVARDDEEACLAIQQQLIELLQELDNATETGEVKNIRDVATRARAVQRMLVEDSAEEKVLGAAVKAARKVARDITRRVEKQGEQLVTVLQESNRTAISSARFAFMQWHDALQARMAGTDTTGTPQAPATVDLPFANYIDEDDEDYEDDAAPSVSQGRFAVVDQG